MKRLSILLRWSANVLLTFGIISMAAAGFVVIRIAEQLQSPFPGTYTWGDVGYRVVLALVLIPAALYLRAWSDGLAKESAEPHGRARGG